MFFFVDWLLVLFFLYFEFCGCIYVVVCVFGWLVLVCIFFFVLFICECFVVFLGGLFDVWFIDFLCFLMFYVVVLLGLIKMLKIEIVINIGSVICKVCMCWRILGFECEGLFCIVDKRDFECIEKCCFFCG